MRGASLNSFLPIKPDPDMKRVKSVTLDRKLSSSARIPQRSTVVEAPAGRFADETGQILSARDEEALTPETGGASTTLDVIRPAFARNNTNVLVVKDTPEADQPPPDSFVLPSINADEDAITLGDIAMLAQHKRADDRPMMSMLDQVQTVIVKHFALLQLQKSPIAHLLELDDVLELLDVRKSQWWSKIFKGNAKKEQKKKGESRVIQSHTVR